MNFKGKYTIVRKGKNGDILSKNTQYNKITNVGKNIVLNLFKNATATTFKQMVGYKPLDLSPYKIKPLFKVKTSQLQQTYSQKIVLQDQYQTEFIELKNKKIVNSDSEIVWDVKSSFFFDKNSNFKENESDTQELFVSLNKTASITYEKNYYTDDEKEAMKQQPRYYIDYSEFDNQLTNSGNNAKSNVDRILDYRNDIPFTWAGGYVYSGTDREEYFLSRNVHNIDFFLVRCKQKIKFNANADLNVNIPLWNGMNQHLKGVTLTSPKVKFKYSSEGEYEKSLMVLHKNINNAWERLSTADYSITQDKQNIFVRFVNNNFSTSEHQFLLFYNVYYLDDQLQNGVCGMYLNYNLIQDTQKKSMGTYINERMLFGNGVFSYDGFQTLDDKVAFPWQGKPITLSCTRQGHANNRQYNYFCNLDYNYQDQDSSTHKLFTTSQYIDYVSERFYSFYPYVSHRPTNFVFMLHLGENKLNITNFVFLVPQLRTTTPRVFVFGDLGNNQSAQQQVMTNELFRTDAIQCSTESESDLSLITWKTYLDYDTGNGNEIKQLGLACGVDKLNQTPYGWNYIKPIKKQECHQLFSKIVLEDSILKTDQQALEVIYELVVQ